MCTVAVFAYLCVFFSIVLSASATSAIKNTREKIAPDRKTVASAPRSSNTSYIIIIRVRIFLHVLITGVRLRNAYYSCAPHNIYVYYVCVIRVRYYIRVLNAPTSAIIIIFVITELARAFVSTRIFLHPYTRFGPARSSASRSRGSSVAVVRGKKKSSASANGDVLGCCAPLARHTSL